MEQIFDNPLFENFSRKDLNLVRSLIFKKEFQENETIVHQGDTSTDLYLIEGGEVRVIQEDQGNDYLLDTIKKGGLFGEIAFIDHQPRSARVVATEPTSTWILQREALSSNIPLLKKILKNLMSLGVDKFRELNSNYAKNLEDNLKNLKKRKQTGIYMLRIYFLLSLIFFLEYILTNIGLDTRGDVGSFVRMLILSTVIFYFLRKEGISFEEYGMTLKRWPRAILEGIAWGIACSVVAVGIFMLFQGLEIQTYFTQLRQQFADLKWWVPIGYFFHAFLQEFSSRLGFQVPITQFLDDKKGYISIFIVSINSAAIHFHWALIVAFLVFLGNLVFGYIYQRRRNLLEVTIIHTIVGFLVLSLGGSNSP